MSGFLWRIYQPGATKAGSYSVQHADSFTIFDNLGDTTVAPGTVFTLPSTAAVNRGTTFTFINQTAGGIQLRASGTDIIRFPLSDSSAGGTQTCASIGGAVTVTRASAGFWNAINGVAGAWTGA